MSEPIETSPDTLLTYEQAASLVNVHSRTLKRWVQMQRLPVIRFNRRCVRLELTMLRNFISSARESPDAQ